MKTWDDILEHAIIGRVIQELIDNGFRLEMSDQDGGGLFIYAAEDGGTKPEGGYRFWVQLTPGNGADVITDYTTNLEDVLEPVNAFSAHFQD